MYMARVICSLDGIYSGGYGGNGLKPYFLAAASTAPPHPLLHSDEQFVAYSTHPPHQTLAGVAGLEPTAHRHEVAEAPAATPPTSTPSGCAQRARLLMF
jgi:hypothetical protein